jgi:hypothetical protein
MRIINSGTGSALLKWHVGVKNKKDEPVRCFPLYSPSIMSNSGEPFKTINHLQDSKLDTGASAMVAVGFHLFASLEDLEYKTLFVMFEDAWENKFVIGPAFTVGLS